MMVVVRDGGVGSVSKLKTLDQENSPVKPRESSGLPVVSSRLQINYEYMQWPTRREGIHFDR